MTLTDLNLSFKQPDGPDEVQLNQDQIFNYSFFNQYAYTFYMFRKFLMVACGSCIMDIEPKSVCDVKGFSGEKSMFANNIHNCNYYSCH